jgi:hypothetical protein
MGVPLRPFPACRLRKTRGRQPAQGRASILSHLLLYEFLTTKQPQDELPDPASIGWMHTAPTFMIQAQAVSLTRMFGLVHSASDIKLEPGVKRPKFGGKQRLFPAEDKRPIGMFVLGLGSWVLGLGSWVLGLGSWVLAIATPAAVTFGRNRFRRCPRLLFQ